MRQQVLPLHATLGPHKGLYHQGSEQSLWHDSLITKPIPRGTLTWQLLTEFLYFIYLLKDTIPAGEEKFHYLHQSLVTCRFPT